MSKISKIIGSLLLIAGTGLLLKDFHFFDFSTKGVFYLLLTFLSLLIFYYSYGSEKKYLIYITVTFFFFGLLYFLEDYNKVALSAEINLSTVLISTAVASLLIYFENLKNVGFLLISLSIFIIGLIFFLGRSDLISNYSELFSIFDFNILSLWPALLIVIGLKIILGRA